MDAARHRRDIVLVLAKLGLLPQAEARDGPASDLMFADLKMDSLTVLDFCVNLEERTGLEIEPADLAAHPSLDALAALLERKAAGAVP